MKKFFALFVALILVVTSLSVSATDFDKDITLSEYPVIVVPGYSASQLCIKKDGGTKQQVWGLDFADMINRASNHIFAIVKGFSDLAKGNPEGLAQLIGKEFQEMTEYLRCDGDGKSIYELENFYFKPEETNAAYVIDNDINKIFRHERQIMDEIVDYVGYENIFSFNSDFRMSALISAERLRTYIKAVKEYTGAEKVNIFAISHGGQITGTYLSLYADDMDVDNVLMTVPALGGSGVIADAFSGTLKFDEEMLIRFLEYALVNETSYDRLLKSDLFDLLDVLLDEALPYMLDLMGNWGSVWDFCPTEYYEKYKAERLDEVENAGLIATSDKMHYEIMPNYGKAFAHCRELGMNVNIIAGTGHQIIFGLNQNSDSVLTVKAVTGATCAPFGSRFPDGYTQVVESDKYYVSPSMEIDASTAYLPDNTWFIDGMFHGMLHMDEFSRDLMSTLLMTDEIQSVWDDPNYPQFHANSNPASAVFASFNNSKEGFLSSDDTRLNITNVCKNHSVILLTVTCDGADITFSNIFKRLEPGESVSIPYKGDLPKKSLTTIAVNITYLELGCLTPFGERTFDYTLMNGEAAVGDTYDFVPAEPELQIKSILPSKVYAAIEDAGIETFAEMIYDVVDVYF